MLAETATLFFNPVKTFTTSGGVYPSALWSFPSFGSQYLPPFALSSFAHLFAVSHTHLPFSHLAWRHDLHEKNLQVPPVSSSHVSSGSSCSSSSSSSSSIAASCGV